MSLGVVCKQYSPFNGENDNGILFSFYYVCLHCDHFASEQLLLLIVVVGKPHRRLSGYGQLVVLQASFP